MKAYSKLFVIADVQVRNFRKEIAQILQDHDLENDFEFLELEISESLKTLTTAETLIRELLHRGADRHALFVGVGGGVLTDLVGFVASIYMRGVKFAFIPTTLLAQVDAAVGGKNGVDLDAYKNIIGRIQQPEWVCRDTAFLKTLPQAEWRNGLAELLKTFILFDAPAYRETVSLFERLFAGASAFPQKEKELQQLQSLIDRCAEYKLAVVRRDEQEQGERRLLNLGHTFAHAIEKCSGEQIPHGQAVAVGMIYAAEIARKFFGKVSAYKQDAFGFPEQLKDDFTRLGLRTSAGIPMAELFQALRKDKKSDGNSIHFILPLGWEDVKDCRMTFDELKDIVYALYQSES